MNSQIIERIDIGHSYIYQRFHENYDCTHNTKYLHHNQQFGNMET